jgi:hypothetical protein
MIAKVELDKSMAPTIGDIVVPLSAVVRWPKNNDSYAVYVVKREHGKLVARIRRITLGETLDYSIAVKTGLNIGDKVITNGATLVSDGRPISIVE